MTHSCSECDRPAIARGWCRSHYMRWWRHGDPLASPERRIPDMRIPIETRFWSKVDLSRPDVCWLWTGSKRHDYGEVWRDGKRIYAHRAAFELVHGPIAPGHVVCHSCDTPLCVRPDHLFAGTQADNVRDMVAKGRGRNQFGAPKKQREDAA